MAEPWLTINEAARHLKMKSGTFKNYVSKGAFPFHLIPGTGTRRYLASDLDAQMQKKFSKKAKRGSKTVSEKLPGS